MGLDQLFDSLDFDDYLFLYNHVASVSASDDVRLVVKRECNLTLMCDAAEGELDLESILVGRLKQVRAEVRLNLKSGADNFFGQGIVFDHAQGCRRHEHAASSAFPAFKQSISVVFSLTRYSHLSHTNRVTLVAGKAKKGDKKLALAPFNSEQPS